MNMMNIKAVLYNEIDEISSAQQVFSIVIEVLTAFMLSRFALLYLFQTSNCTQ